MEIENLLPIVNIVSNNFYKKAMFYIQRFNYKLDNISEGLANDNLKIISSKKDEINKVIINIKNSKIKIY